jgi:SAM-dependent methyltransferase
MVPSFASTDAFGQLLLDHFTHQKPVYYVIERDDGNIDVDDSSGYFSTYTDWSLEEQSILDQASSPILDIGCGAGRHSLYFQEKGFEVVALDISPGALEVAKRRGIKNTICHDIKSFPSFSQTFGSFLFMGNNFALCGNPQTAGKILTYLASIATSDARLIAHFRDPSPDDPSLDPIHREYHAQNQSKGLPVGQAQIRILYRKSRTPWMPFYMPTLNEFSDLIASTDSWKINTVIQKEDFIFTVVKRI